MAECTENFFIHNKRVKDCSEFNDQQVLTGKSFYEVIRLIDGVFLFLEDHLERLKNSFLKSNLNYPVSNDFIGEKLKLLKLENELAEGNVKIVINFTNNAQTADFYTYFISHVYPSVEQYEKGIRLMLYNTERKNPNVKQINLELNQIRTRELAINPVYELLLVDKLDYVTEASKANVFMVKGEKVFTPPADEVLPGITRNYVLELCAEMGIEIIEKRIPAKTLPTFDAAFISGTSPKILPVNTIDNNKFMVNNPVVRKLMNAYDFLVNKYIKEHKTNKNTRPDR